MKTRKVDLDSRAVRASLIPCSQVWRLRFPFGLDHGSLPSSAVVHLLPHNCKFESTLPPRNDLHLGLTLGTLPQYTAIGVWNLAIKQQQEKLHKHVAFKKRRGEKKKDCPFSCIIVRYTKLNLGTWLMQNSLWIQSILSSMAFISS